MGWYEWLSADNTKQQEVACSHWTAEEADKQFGRNRPRTGIIHCAGCNKPAR